MTHQRLATCILVPAALAAAPASATWLSGADLERHCDAYLDDSEGDDAAACVAFVQGFLSGAEAIGKAAGLPPSPPSSAESSFAERAARTRVGSRLRNMRAERNSYCLDDSVSPASVIEIVVGLLSEQTASDDVPAERMVHRALVENFPCDEQ